MSELAELRNLGLKSAVVLKSVGIGNYAELQAVGAVAAFLRVRAAGHPSSLNLLWALTGALLDIHWASIPEELKEQLKKELEDGKGPGA